VTGSPAGLTEVKDRQAIVLLPLEASARCWQDASRDENGVVSHSRSAQEWRPVDRLSELLDTVVQFAYSCWDRIVVTGYIERLQHPENLVHFFHDIAVQCAW
jgi:hypothetical protein